MNRKSSTGCASPRCCARGAGRSSGAPGPGGPRRGPATRSPAAPPPRRRYAREVAHSGAGPHQTASGGLLAGVGGVADGADVVLDEVLERDQPDGGAPGVDRAPQVRAGPAQHGERHVEPVGDRHLGQAADPLRRHRGAGVVGEVEDVLDVQVAGEARAGAHREPGEAGRRRRPRRRRRRPGRGGSDTSSARRHQHVGDGGLRRGRVRVSRRDSSSSSRPSRPDSAIRSASSPEVNAVLQLVARLHADEPQHAVGHHVEQADDRAHHGGEHQERRHQPDRGALRARRSRCSWAPSRRAACARRPRRPARSRTRSGAARRRAARASSNGRSMRCATAGSPRRPSSSEQIVMPSWTAASMRDRSAPRLQHRGGARGARAGHRLQPVAAGGDQRELGADEERVGQQQERRPRSRASRSLLTDGLPVRHGGGATAAGSATRLRSRRITVRCHPSTSTSSPTSGMRPSRASTSPASVS